MELINLDLEFTVCKIKDVSEVDFNNEFIFLSKTDDEISLVCETKLVPGNAIAVESGWNALKISGVLDFGMVGVIAAISSLLYDAEISIFVISTFNTDYILLKSDALNRSIEILQNNGYIIK